MKKAMLLMILVLALPLGGCSGRTIDDAQSNVAAAVDATDQTAVETTAEPTKAPSKEVVDIREKLFIAQVNEIYANADDYMDKTIRYEGVFDCYPYTEAGDMFYSVIRYGPGCCGNDGNVGFEVIWDNPYPNQGDWVYVEGELEEYEEYGETYLRLRASRLNVLTKRGNESVSQ